MLVWFHITLTTFRARITTIHLYLSKLYLNIIGSIFRTLYIPIHTIVERLHFDNVKMESITAFHAITGSDTTSYLYGHGKKTCWKVYQEHSHLFQGLDRGELDDVTAKNAELFICKLYNVLNVTTVNKTREIMFVKSSAPMTLPPTGDAL